MKLVDSSSFKSNNENVYPAHGNHSDKDWRCEPIKENPITRTTTQKKYKSKEEMAASADWRRNERLDQRRPAEHGRGDSDMDVTSVGRRQKGLDSNHRIHRRSTLLSAH